MEPTLTLRPGRVGPGIALIKSTRLWMNATEADSLDAAALASTDLARQVERARSIVAADRAALAVLLLSDGYRRVDVQDLLGGISRTRLGHLVAAAS